jgi:hypothetical protein
MIKGQWYHLQRKQIGNEYVSACFCPRTATGKCVHQMFLEDCGEEHFPDDGLFNGGKYDFITLIFFCKLISIR